MKKKLWCVLCIMICMMMIAACGQKKESGEEKSEKETKSRKKQNLKTEKVLN